MSPVTSHILISPAFAPQLLRISPEIPRLPSDASSLIFPSPHCKKRKVLQKPSLKLFIIIILPYTESISKYVLMFYIPL